MIEFEKKYKKNKISKLYFINIKEKIICLVIKFFYKQIIVIDDTIIKIILSLIPLDNLECMTLWKISHESLDQDPLQQ